MKPKNDKGETILKNMLRKAMVFAAGAALATAFAGSSFAADAQKVDLSGALDQSGVSKHYDPAHMGHSHQCANCKRTYNQQGDNGPYSAGSNICPNCGFANQVPPSPNPNPYPPQPPVPPTPYPPQPPVPPTPYPPTPNPNYGENVDVLINLWDRSSDYRTADNIIVAGAARVYSLKGLCRLAVKAYYRESTNSIIGQMNRPDVVNDMTPEDVLFYWNKATNYETADFIASTAARKFMSVKGILRISVALYYRNVANDLLAFVDSSYGRLVDPPTVADLKFYWNKASNYELADRILLSGARYLRSIAELAEAANIAYYQNTRRAIEAMYANVGPAPSPYNPYPGYRAVETSPLDEPQAKKQTKKQAVQAVALSDEAKAGIEAAIADLANQNTAIDLSSDDIKNVDQAKISAFTAKYKAGAFKKSDFLKLTVDSLTRRLKEESLKNPQAMELLMGLK